MEDLGGIWGFRAFACSLDFPCGSDGKASAYNAGDPRSIPGLGRSPGEGKGYPLQYSSLENSMDCIVRGVAKSRTRLSKYHFHYSVIFIKKHLSSKVDNSLKK